MVAFGSDLVAAIVTLATVVATATVYVVVSRLKVKLVDEIVSAERLASPNGGGGGGCFVSVP
jgi:hypothetical protein